MTKYMIKLKETEVYVVEVEADSADEAEMIAIEKFDSTSEDSKKEYWNDSEGEASTICESKYY